MLKILAVMLLGSAFDLVAQHPSAAYEAVLLEIQQDFPDRGLVLMNPAVEGTQKDEPQPVLQHPSSWIERLKEREIIVASCVPPPNTIGCSDPFPEVRVPTLTLALFPLEWMNNQPEIRATLVRVSDAGRLYVEQRVYTLRQRGGEWEVVSCRIRGIS